MMLSNATVFPMGDQAAVEYEASTAFVWSIGLAPTYWRIGGDRCRG
jgi:hypothetical protein